MMRNLLKILLVSSALVAVSAPSAYAALQESTVPAEATAEERTAIETAYAELLAAVTAPDVNAAVSAAIQNLRDALGDRFDIGTILTGILVDIATTEDVDGAAFSVMAGAVATAEPSVDTDAVDAAAVSAGLEGYQAISAIPDGTTPVVVDDPVEDTDDGDNGTDPSVSIR